MNFDVLYSTINTFYVKDKTHVMISKKNVTGKNYTLQVFVTCLGLLSAPFKGLSDLQLRNL